MGCLKKELNNNNSNKTFIVQQKTIYRTITHEKSILTKITNQILKLKIVKRNVFKLQIYYKHLEIVWHLYTLHLPQN